MRTFAQNLEKYAELAVSVGVNVQEGQNVLVKAPIDAGPLVRYVTDKAYQAGARQVYYNWRDDALDHLRLRYASAQELSVYPQWKADYLEGLVRGGAACIDIRTTGLGVTDGIDPRKSALDQQAYWRALHTYYDIRMSDKVSWTLLSYPNAAWAKKIYPGKISELAIRDLWSLIFSLTRIDQSDPIAAWQRHLMTLEEKKSLLNSRKYRRLHYMGPGTDLEIRLDAAAHWDGGMSQTTGGVSFVANIPTEEVYTLPLKTGVSGVVTSTRPLVYAGTLIEGIRLTFTEGRITEAYAKTGEQVLRQIIETDEGAHYLGEVALVANDSPISSSGKIFYTTLFDENASCHLAIGKAYPTCLDGGAEMTVDQLAAHGANESLVHVDFMIGSGDLAIDGQRSDGQWEPVFRNGLWAF
ncbi:MAG: aminopeptidase [Sporolactobacillus sp.]